MRRGSRLVVLVAFTTSAAACRTWEDAAIAELLAVPTAADASCVTLAVDLQSRGRSLVITGIEFSDTNVLALDETLVIRARVPHFKEHSRTLDHEEQVDGFDLELQCPYWGDPTPLTVRMCLHGGQMFGVVDPTPLQTLTHQGEIKDTCRLWGQLWTGERMHAWMASVIVRPSVRSIVETR